MLPSNSEVPGTIARHIIITPECLEGRGQENAIDVAFGHVKDELKACIAGWSRNEDNKVKGASFHLILTVERLTNQQ